MGPGEHSSDFSLVSYVDEHGELRSDSGAQSEPAEIAASRVGKPTETDERSGILYIDSQHLTRDCITEQLAVHLPEWRIESVRSACEVPSSSSDRDQLSLGILHIHAASVSGALASEELRAIAAATPGLPVAIMSELNDAEKVKQAIRAGARGYLPTNLPIKQAIAAIRLMAQGGIYLQPTALVAKSLPQKELHSPATNGLSPRELQVLAQLRYGKPNKMIAYELGMRESTVKVHIRHIMKKLNARNRTQVVLMTSAVDAPQSPKPSP
jgi:DNA-binding NarL/FixJ family response regulator